MESDFKFNYHCIGNVTETEWKIKDECWKSPEPLASVGVEVKHDFLKLAESALKMSLAARRYVCVRRIVLI